MFKNRVDLLSKGDIIDYTPWCEDGTKATATVVSISDIGPGRTSMKATMFAVDGATEDRYGMTYNTIEIWLPLDSDQEITVLSPASKSEKN